MFLCSWTCALWWVTKVVHVVVVVVVLKMPRLYPSHCLFDLFKVFLWCRIKISSQSISDEDTGQHSSRLYSQQRTQRSESAPTDHTYSPFTHLSLTQGSWLLRPQSYPAVSDGAVIRSGGWTRYLTEERLPEERVQYFGCLSSFLVLLWPRSNKNVILIIAS